MMFPPINEKCEVIVSSSMVEFALPNALSSSPCSLAVGHLHKIILVSHPGSLALKDALCRDA
jgi:hypothetical protein